MPNILSEKLKRQRWSLYGGVIWLALQLLLVFAWKPHVLENTFVHIKSVETQHLESLLKIMNAEPGQDSLQGKMDIAVTANQGWKSWKKLAREFDTANPVPDRDAISALSKQGAGAFLVQVELDRKYFLSVPANELDQQIVILALVTLLVLLFVVTYVRVRIERPMQKFIAATERIAHGDFHQGLDDNSSFGIFQGLVFSFRTMSDNLQHALAIMEEEVQAVKESEEKFRVSEEQFRTVFENVADIIIIIDENGKIQRANPAISKILGYLPEQLAGKNVNVLVPPYLRENHNDYIARYLETGIKKVIDSGVFELPMINANGDEVICGLSVSEMKLGNGRFFVGLIRDISGRLQMEQSIRRERDRAQKYLDTVEVIILAHDTEGRISLVNRKGKEVLQRSGGGCLGENWYDCCVDQSVRDELREMMNEIASGAAPILEYMEYPISTGSGETRYIAWHYSKLADEQGNVTGFLCSGEDITEHRKNEQERYRLKTQLIQAQKMESVGQLTGGIAHDFNNILASVLGYAELAKEYVDHYHDDKLNAYLANIYQAGTRARDLVEKMLAYSRGKGGIGKAELSLVPVIQDVLKMLRSVLPSSVSIKPDLDIQVPSIRIDTIELQQVIMNLCINARDAMDGQGEITIRVRWHRNLSANCSSCYESFSGEYIELAIADNGPGIPEEEQQRIFEPFFSTKAMGKGSGMGLSVVHGIVHGRGGHIQLESKPGQGTTFHLYFRPATAERVDVVAETKSSPAPRKFGNTARVMVVDDHQETAQGIRTLLESDGFRVSVESDPVEALRKYRQDPSSCDMVITDLSISGMTGVELAALLLMEQPRLPILICSDNITAIDKEQLIAAGVRGVISKSLLQADLVTSVREALLV